MTELIAPSPGTVWASRYEVERLLGTGSSAIVYVARDLKSNERVALRVANFRDNRVVAYGLRQLLLDFHVRRSLSDPRMPRALRLSMAPTPYSVSELFSLTDLHSLIDAGTLPTEVQAVDFLRAWTALQADLVASGVFNFDLSLQNICFAEPWSAPRLVDFGMLTLDSSWSTDLAAALGGFAQGVVDEGQADGLFLKSVEILYSACLGFEPWGGIQRIFAKRMTPAPSAKRNRPQLGLAAEWLDTAVARRHEWCIADFARHIGLPPARSLRAVAPSAADLTPSLEDFLARPRLQSLALVGAARSLSLLACTALVLAAEREGRCRLWRLMPASYHDDSIPDLPNSLFKQIERAPHVGTHEHLWQGVLAHTRVKPLVMIMDDADFSNEATLRRLAAVPPDAHILFIYAGAKAELRLGEHTDLV